jgi:hypothetical protein
METVERHGNIMQLMFISKIGFIKGNTMGIVGNKNVA